MTYKDAAALTAPFMVVIIMYIAAKDQSTFKATNSKLSGACKAGVIYWSFCQSGCNRVRLPAAHTIKISVISSLCISSLFLLGCRET